MTKERNENYSTKQNNHNHHHHNSIKNIKIAFFMNFGFTILELIGGIYTNSVAIIADAIHDLGDTLSLGLAWFLEKYSNKKRTSKFSYGYKRFSLLGALITSSVLVIGSIFVLLEVIPRLLNPQSSDATGMFILAIIGVLVNGYGVYKVSKGNSLNEKVISWHLLEDVLGWVAVLIVALVNLIVEVKILDPLLALVFTIFILYNIFKNLKEIIQIFLQATPNNLNVKIIEENLIKNIKEINSIHDVHIWSLDGENSIMTLHCVIGKNLDLIELSKLKKEIRKELEKNNLEHITIEFEIKDEVCKLTNC